MNGLVVTDPKRRPDQAWTLAMISTIDSNNAIFGRTYVPRPLASTEFMPDGHAVADPMGIFANLPPVPLSASRQRKTNTEIAEEI